MSEMRKLRRRDRDKHRACEARVVGGPHNGLLVPVKEKDGDFLFPTDAALSGDSVGCADW
jgi:hypothetical protein